MDRPVRRRRGRPPGPPKTAVNPDALRWLLIGFMAGAGWNSRELADYAGIAKQRISDILNRNAQLPSAGDTLGLLALFDLKTSEVMMAPPAAEAEEAHAA